MPADTPPLIYLCASAQDRAFVEMVAARLQARGLEVHEGAELGEPAPIDVRQRAVEACAALLVVVSPAGKRPPVVAADYRHALARGIPVIPLIVASPRDLPRDLDAIQAADFSRSHETGWHALLLALDALGLVRQPAAGAPDLDVELALARMRAGRIPPTWIVSRETVRGRRHLSRMTIYGWALTLAVTAATVPMMDQKPLLLLTSAYTLYLLYAKFSPRPRRLDRRAPAVVVTPEGVIVQTAAGDAVWAAWREATVENLPGSRPIGASAVLLQARSLAGPHAVAVPMERLLGGAVLAERALASYAAYLAAYESGQASARLASALPSIPPPSPLVFLSYSRRDADFVDRLDLVLQHSGYRTWVDRSELVGGTEWSRELEQALDQCAAVVVVVSPTAMRSSYVRREYQHALQAGTPVIAVLARTTRRIPPELRPRVRADCREALILGALDLGLALDEAGIRPALTGALEQTRLAAGAMPTLARALRGQAPPHGQVYRGRFQSSLLVWLLALFVTAALEFGLYLQSGSLFFMALIGVAQLGFVPPLVLFALRRLRYPDIIVALPDGYITFYGSGVVQQHPFAALQSVSIHRVRLGGGVALVNTPPAPSKPYTVPILPTFRARKRIAGRIVADFARYQQERGAEAIAGEGRASGGRGARE